MRTGEIRVVHVSPRVQAQGGIESIHAYNRALPLEQDFVALFDRQPQAWPNYVNLNFNWRTPLWRMRRDFGRVMAGRADRVVVYHNGWGLPLLHDRDGASRRIVCLHAMPAYHDPDLPACRGLVDGAFGITPALRASWAKYLPELSPARTMIYRLPIAPPAGLAAARAPSLEITLGYAGRIERRHKRLDRLPAFLDALERTGLRFRFEVLGDGSFRTELLRILGDRVRFHGWTTKEEFWRVLASWDGMVFFSDVEGGPIAMVEGMAMGVIPFFPVIGGSMGDAYAPQIDARCHYPAGDMTGLARSVGDVFALPPEKRAAAQAKARALAARHSGPDYASELMAYLNSIAEQPKLAPFRRRRPRLTDLLPLGLVTRVAPWALRLN